MNFESHETRSDRTPCITRRPAPLFEFESSRVGGRVHAVVMPLGIYGEDINNLVRFLFAFQHLENSISNARSPVISDLSTNSRRRFIKRKSADAARIFCPVAGA